MLRIQRTSSKALLQWGRTVIGPETTPAPSEPLLGAHWLQWGRTVIGPETIATTSATTGSISISFNGAGP